MIATKKNLKKFENEIILKNMGENEIKRIQRKK